MHYTSNFNAEILQSAAFAHLRGNRCAGEDQKRKSKKSGKRLPHTLSTSPTSKLIDNRNVVVSELGQCVQVFFLMPKF